MSALAVLMTFAAFLAPFAAVLGLILWFTRSATRRGKGGPDA
jgi:amino acid transporter